MWFQNRRAKFRRNERCLTRQQTTTSSTTSNNIYNNNYQLKITNLPNQQSSTSSNTTRTSQSTLQNNINYSDPAENAYQYLNPWKSPGLLQQDIGLNLYTTSNAEGINSTLNQMEDNRNPLSSCGFLAPYAQNLSINNLQANCSFVGQVSSINNSIAHLRYRAHEYNLNSSQMS